MNLTDINPLTLPSLPLTERSQLPKCSAVYFVSNDDCILYIGRTTNLYQRWLAHHIWQHLYGVSGELKVAWLECNNSELLPEIENALIVYFKPLLNKVAGKQEKVPVKTFISEAVLDDFKAACAKVGRTKSDVAAELVKQWVDSQPQKQLPKNDSDKGAA